MPFFKNHYIISIKIYGVEKSGVGWGRENLIKLYVFALVWVVVDVVVSALPSRLSHISVNFPFFLFSGKVFRFGKEEVEKL